MDADTALEYFFLLDEIGQPLLSSSSESSSDESDMFVVIDSEGSRCSDEGLSDSDGSSDGSSDGNVDVGGRGRGAGVRGERG